MRFEGGEGRLALARPLRVGPVTVRSLLLSLGRLEGPVDLGAGVARFRHVRTRVMASSVALDLRALQQWDLVLDGAAPRLDGTDLTFAVSEGLLQGLRRWEVPHEQADGRVRVPRPLHVVLREALVPHGWRVPDDGDVRLAVAVEGSVLELAAEVPS
ncbi:MAG: hypothetical protein ACODAU_02150 [Myxococcota bacterium]